MLDKLIDQEIAWRCIRHPLRSLLFLLSMNAHTGACARLPMNKPEMLEVAAEHRTAWSEAESVVVPTFPMGCIFVGPERTRPVAAGSVAGQGGTEVAG